MKKINLTFIICLFVLAMANAQSEVKLTAISSDVKYQLIGTYDLTRLNQVFNKDLDDFLSTSTMSSAEFKGKFATPVYPVKLYKVEYRSVVPEFGNKPAITSGLVAIPETGLDSMPMISYQHGTVFEKTSCPSHPDESMETRMMIAQYASQGYVVIGADYFGLADSDLPNAYLILESSVQACLDMLYAAQDVLRYKKIKQGPLFLHGWSQGGWTNMAFLRKLESLNIPVTAAGTASAPSEVFGTMDRWLNNYQPIDAVYLPACLSNFIFALEYYNQMPGFAATAIRPEFYQTARDFYDWKISWTDFRKVTGDTVQKFFRPEFMATGNMGSTRFWELMEKSQVYRWRCKTPLTMYYGERDEVVPIYVATLPQEFHKLIGRTTTVAKSAGAKADHRATYTTSVIFLKPWFDGFLKK
jgi:pimeloyl-ACP methyl ester carboxylesterase